MRNLKKFLALVLATLMVVSAMVATTVSAAADDHTVALEALNRMDVYRGYGDSMGDADLVTRWHMALFVSRITTGFTNDSAWNTTANDTPFTDVTKDHYLGAIATAYKAGIIEGVGNNKFDPNANIKYQDALTMVVRALGYKDLDYPLGYIQKAQALGLTNNLNSLDNKLETAITRGQTAQILYNALWVDCKDGTNLLEDVLKFKMADVIVVATENQTYGSEELAKKGEVILSNGVALEAALLLNEGETSDDILGYSFKIATNNNWETLVTAYRCDSKVLVNYGADKNDIKHVQQGTAPNLKFRTDMIKLDGTNYSWNGGMVSSGYPDFIAHQKVEMAYGTGAYMTFYYNTNGDIVDVDGTILLYNIDGVFYKNITGDATVEVLRKATTAEINACLRPVKETTTAPDMTYDIFNCYQQIDACADIWNNKFCEMRVFDDDGDGKWDRGLLTPYSIGIYSETSKTASSSYTVMDYAGNSVKTSSSRTVATIDGTVLGGYNGATATSAVLASGLTFEGGKPAKGDTVIYTYNAFTGVFEVIENLGTYKKGNVTEINGRGSYVVIDGTKYFYNLTEANLKNWNKDDINITLIQTVIVDKTYVIDYFATAGYLIETGKVNPYGFNNYVVFTHGDLARVDAAGNLYVNALVDATGVKKEIKISDVENFKVGLAMYDYIKNSGNHYLAGNSYWVGSSATAVTNATLREALAHATTLSGTSEWSVLPKNIYAGRLNADGSYSLVPFTPFSAYDPITNKADKDAVNVVDNKNAAVITINYGINNDTYVSSVASGDSLIATKGKFDTTADTVYVFVGHDDIRIFKGVAPNGATIDLTGADTVLLNANASCVFVVDMTKAVDTLYTGWTVASTPTVNSDYIFYAIVAETKASITEANVAGKSTLAVTKLHNVLTGELVDVIVTADHDYNMDVFEAINAKWALTDASVNCANLILCSESENKFEIISDDYAEFVTYLTALWANYTTRIMNVDLGKLNNVYTLIAGGTSMTVQSYKLKTFWGYEGTVEVIDGSTTHDFTKASTTVATVRNPGEKAFIAIDANGNATGFVFAPGMSKVQ